MRLEHEARKLIGLGSEYYPDVLAVAREADAVLVVSDYVAGPSLETWLPAGGRLSLDETLAVARCTLCGLRDVHARDVLHRDVRPANLIVRGDDLSRVALVDFGPTRGWDADRLGRANTANLAWYLSPEQAGSIDQDLTPASDLYSVGVLMFVCLTGSSPFAGASVSEVLLSHMTTPVPKLRELGIDVPRPIDELLQRLLRKDPRDRFQTAQAVLADLDAIQQALTGQGQQTIVIGSRDERRTLTEPSFVGREAELQAIDRCLQETAQGHKRLVLVESESGGGKTRFLSEVLQRAACAGFRVFRGSCSNQVGQSGLTLFDGVVAAFLALEATDPRLSRQLRDWPEDDREALTSTLPELRPLVAANANGSGLPEEFREEPKLQALQKFLSVLGSAEHPAVVIWDDCQWADEFTYKLMQRWSQRGRSTPQYVMLVAAHRSEEVGLDHALHRVPADETLQLGDLTEAEIRLLVESMAGPLPASAVELICRVADGSPFMASAVLRGLVETGALTPRDGDWLIDEAAMAECQSSTRAALFLSRRIDMLSSHTRDLLAAGAVLGREFALDSAAALSGCVEQHQVEALDEARRRHLVWLRPDDATCVFLHDKIRESLLAQLPSRTRRRLHLAAAENLIATNQIRDVELAFHYDAGGESRLALPFALKAADQARSRYVLSVAEQQYEIARRGGGELPQPLRFRVAEGLGDVLMLRGDYERAEQLFEEARQLASSRFEVAQVLGKLAELSFKRGDMARSASDYERALHALGIAAPSNAWRLGWHLLLETCVQVAHTLLPRRVHRLKRPPDAEERLRLRLISGLSHAYWYLRSKPMILWAHLRGLNDAERFNPSLELAHLYADHAPAMSLVTLFRRAYRYAEKSLAIRREFGDVWGQGHSFNYYGVALYAASRYEECIVKCREAIRLLERTGDFWQVHIARYQVAASLYRLGDFQGAQREAQRNHLSGIELGDEQTSGVNLDVWARVTHGKVPRDILDRELQRDRYDSQGTCHVLLADGICRLAEGDAEVASDILQRAIDVAAEAGIHNAYSMPARAWHVTALRQAAEATSSFAPRKRRHKLIEARRAAHRALRASWVSRNDLPHLYRELALIHSLLGKPRRAARSFAKSLAWAEQHKAEYERASTLLEWGTVGREYGWRGAQDRIDQGELLLTQVGLADPRRERAAVGPKQTLSLADRFDTLLDDGRQIASALSEDEIFEFARLASIRLLRGEHCSVLKLSDGRAGQNIQFVGAPAPGINLTLVRRAVESGKTIAAVDELENASGDATLIGRSVICAPIKVRDSVQACLYVTHDQVRNLFGETEVRLADFVATIAGAACENAEGFAQLQTLNETLEQRVAERTDQLRVAIQQAEAANEAKSRFLATMSHEIRTPMNGILGMTELALKSSPTTQQRNCLNVVKQSGDALMSLLNDVLDLSKIEAGKLDLECIPLDVRNVIENAVRLFSTSAYKKRVELVCRVAPTTPASVLGDPNRLRQIVINLLGNAIKFTDQGVIDVQVEPDLQDGVECLHFRVRDTGIGIPQDKQALIFEAFRQSDSSTTRRFGGTGLGLSISQNLVQLMHGRIWVRSEVGRGSEFHFTVPLATERSAAIVDVPAELAGRQVVLISRDPVGAPVYREILERLGLSVRTVPSLDAARAEAAVDSVAWLLDQPVGESVSRAEFTPCPLIVLGYLNDLGDDSQPHVIKPVTDGELRRCLLTVLAKCGHQSNALSTDVAEPAIVPNGFKVLLADDSPVNQEVAVGLLEYKGYQVQVANNGMEAVEAVRRERFAVVLMDLEMPRMDGFEATHAIRELETSLEYRTPILAMTAHATVETQQRCQAAGMNGYISKPVNPDKLFAAVEEAVLCIEGDWRT